MIEVKVKLCTRRRSGHGLDGVQVSQIFCVIAGSRSENSTKEQENGVLLWIAEGLRGALRADGVVAQRWSWVEFPT